MKAILLSTIIPLLSTQSYNWTWVSGSSGVNQIAMYYPLFLDPGARNGHSGAINPSTNEFIIFGGWKSLGILYTKSCSLSYDYNSNIWRWLSGSNIANHPGVYGTRGVSSPSNQPASRARHTLNVYSASGLLVLFGGESIAIRFRNDLWTFDLITLTWMWISGSDQVNSAGVYGIKGVSSKSNMPGARMGHSFDIFPNTGSALVFGGLGPGLSVLEVGCLNDLWSFNFNTIEWVWIGGSNVYDQPGFYGTKGVPTSATIPRCRFYHSTTKDSNAENLFLLGGMESLNYFRLNDLWVYNIKTNMWTWISGSNVADQPSKYGNRGVSSPNNDPGARYGQRMFYSSKYKTLTMFGGYSSAFLNDLWTFNLTSGQWTWVGGSNTVNQPGVFRSKGISSPDNFPGSRTLFALDYDDVSNRCVLFGGEGIDSTSTAGLLNDLWMLSLPRVENTATHISSGRNLKLSTEISPTLMTSISSTTPQSSSISVNISSYGYSSLLTTNDHQSQPSSISVVVKIMDKINSTLTKTSTSRTTYTSTTLTFFQRYQTLFIFGVLPFILFLILVLLYKLACRAYNLKQEPSPSVYSDTTSTDISLRSVTSFSYTATTTTTTTHTHVPTNQGISLPGFLQFLFGTDYIVRREIAHGAFGAIHIGNALNQKLKAFGDKIIIKQIVKPQFTEKDVNVFHQEVSLIYFLHEHRNIAKLVGYSEKPYCLLMKYYEYGSLDKWIKCNKFKKSRLLLLSFLIDIARGVREMHSKGIAHCDLKPQNILLDQDETGLFCVLTDFGIAQIVTAESLLVRTFEVVNVRGASISYASPEAILRVRKRQNIPGKQLLNCDIYALGVIICEMIKRKSPYW